MSVIGRTIATVSILAFAAVGVAACGSTAAPSGVPLTPLPVSAAVPEVNPAGDIPDNQVFVPWSPADGSFHLSVPEGWARSDNPDTTLFTDKLNSIGISVTAAPTAPTAQSELQAVDALNAGASGFATGDATTVDRKAGSAVLVTYNADGLADAVTGKRRNNDIERYTFWKDGTAVTLTLAGPHGADNVDPWRIVTDAFGWK